MQDNIQQLDLDIEENQGQWVTTLGRRHHSFCAQESLGKILHHFMTKSQSYKWYKNCAIKFFMMSADEFMA